MVYGKHPTFIDLLQGGGKQKKGAPAKKAFGTDKGPAARVDGGGDGDPDEPNSVQQLEQDLSEGDAAVKKLASRANHVRGLLNKTCSQLLESMNGKTAAQATKKTSEKRHNDDEDSNMDGDEETDGDGSVPGSR